MYRQITLHYLHIHNLLMKLALALYSTDLVYYFLSHHRSTQARNLLLPIHHLSYSFFLTISSDKYLPDTGQYWALCHPLKARHLPCGVQVFLILRKGDHMLVRYVGLWPAKLFLPIRRSY